CGAEVVKVLHSPAVHFKGSGFYNTDYGTSKRKRELDKSASEGADKHDAKSKDKSGTSSGSDSGSGSSSSSPSGSVTPPLGLSTAVLESPEVATAPNRPSSDGPLMSERIAFGADQATHGA